MEINLLLTTILVIYQMLYLVICQRLSGGVPYSITTYTPYYPNSNKWFLFDNCLYYIERAEKLANEAQQYCKTGQMQDGIQPYESEDLSKFLVKTYGPKTSCWMGVEYVNSNFTSTEMQNSTTCYAVNATGIYAEECNSRKCVICKREISGGSLQYKNGSHFELDVGEINEFCNPESSKYDDVIQYCLIESFPYHID